MYFIERVFFTGIHHSSQSQPCSLSNSVSSIWKHVAWIRGQCITHRVTLIFLRVPRPEKKTQLLQRVVHLPGARRIKVVFDSRSRTATDCDWLCIEHEEPVTVTSSWSYSPYSYSRGGDVGHPRRTHHFHGRFGRENFPGFGGRPPLWIDGDRLIARFRSNPSISDWGVRFTAYGILDDGEDDVDRMVSMGGAGTTAPRADGGGGGDCATAEKKGRAGNLEVDLCCWVLEILAREGWKGVPDVAARICKSDAFKVFRDCLHSFSQRRKLRVLRLVSCVVSEASRVVARGATADAPPSVSDENSMKPSFDDVDALLCEVLGLVDTQRSAEADPCAAASTYLQALMQCAVLLHGYLVSEARAERPRADGVERRKITPSVEANRVKRNSILEQRLLGMGPGAAAVHALGEILPHFALGTSPDGILYESFLPVLTEACTVTIQSSHPFNDRPLSRSVAVPGAVEMRASFDHRTEMGNHDRIFIRHAGHLRRSASEESSQLPPTSSEAGAGSLLLRERSEIGFLGLAGGTKVSDLPMISIGDSVVRGPDWAFGDEDCDDEGKASAGGPPSGSPRIGVVTALEKWGGRKDNGVRVRWLVGAKASADDSDSCGANATDRQRVDGRFEALYSASNPAHVRVVERGGPDRARRPVVVTGNALEMEVIPGTGLEVMNGGNGGRAISAQSASDVLAGHEWRARCASFDGSSTIVNLPSYRGMRLEGDFVVELWASLEPGAVEDGRRKCVLSRVLDPPLRRGERSNFFGVTLGRDCALGSASQLSCVIDATGHGLDGNKDEARGGGRGSVRTEELDRLRESRSGGKGACLFYRCEVRSACTDSGEGSRKSEGERDFSPFTLDGREEGKESAGDCKCRLGEVNRHAADAPVEAERAGNPRADAHQQEPSVAFQVLSASIPLMIWFARTIGV